jgi:histone demethylase JARID1
MQGIPEAPTFYPSEEEFADPLTYINKIRIEGEKYATPTPSHPL